ncbi:MAG TPA: alpha/beta hydrolase [Jatrophihabitantaceae bacterium]|jgi:pimeloyl-ACP methyl ester carboxylesterase
METMVPVDGGELWTDDTGGAGPAVVLLHPGIGDSTIWDGVLAELAGRVRAIRYDVRAYGRSTAATTQYTTLADLVAVLDHYRLGEVTLVGCSMGGATSLQLALADPARVASLLLVCPGIPGYPWPSDPELSARLEPLAAAGDVDGMAEVGLELWAKAGVDEAARRQMRSAAAAWVNEDEFQHEGEPVLERLGELDSPSVIMVGDLDREPLIDSNEQAAARIPHARLIRVPGADHLLPLRHPKLVATVLLEQLAVTPGR